MRKNIFLVDADNTILDFHASSLLALRKAFSSFQVEWKEEYGEIFTEYNDFLWRQLEKKEITRERLLSIRFPNYLKKLGLSLDGEKFNEIFLRSLAELPVYMRGAESFLKTLRKHGKIYIVTNGTTKIQQARFALCGLNDLVDDVFVSQSIGYDKPSENFTAFMQANIPNFSKEKSVWIGDSLSADILAANEAKIDSVWFNPKKIEGNKKAKPTFTAANFEEILSFLHF